MNIDKMINEVGAAVLLGYAPDVTVEKVEKRLQEARENGDPDEIHFLEEMLKIHKLMEDK